MPVSSGEPYRLTRRLANLDVNLFGQLRTVPVNPVLDNGAKVWALPVTPIGAEKLVLVTYSFIGAWKVSYTGVPSYTSSSS